MIDLTNDQKIAGLPSYLKNSDNIVLNISPTATRSLLIGNEEITFETRFSGQSCSIYLDMSVVLAIFARESQEGMAFDFSDKKDDSSKENVTDKTSNSPNKSGFRLVD